jgi:hypothetical protein
VVGELATRPEVSGAVAAAKFATVTGLIGVVTGIVGISQGALD